jgi:signal recognition particle subunit SEC65
MTTALELEAATAAWLDRVAADPKLEVEWVDLLSQLEYVGFRKITKAVRYDEVTLETLRHMAEEASHAYLMKAAAEKLGLPERSWKDGPFSPAGWAYFQGLDRGVEKQVADPARCYPLVSVAVERRVLVLYPAYLERTRNPVVRRVVERILAQEKKHAALFDARALPAPEVEQACRLEEKLWAELMGGVNKLI